MFVEYFLGLMSSTVSQKNSEFVHKMWWNACEYLVVLLKTSLREKYGAKYLRLSLSTNECHQPCLELVDCEW